MKRIPAVALAVALSCPAFAQSVPLSSLTGTGLVYSGGKIVVVPGTSAGTPRDAAAAIAAEQEAQATANAAIPLAALGQPGGSAQLDGSSKVVAVTLVNRPLITPLLTSVGTTAATVYPVGTYVSIQIAPTTPGAQISCSGNGTPPAIGDGNTVSYGQWLFWPRQFGGSVPQSAVVCVASNPTTISVEAH
jgi:hypothetical protein